MVNKTIPVLMHFLEREEKILVQISVRNTGLNNIKYTF